MNNEQKGKECDAFQFWIDHGYESIHGNKIQLQTMLQRMTIFSSKNLLSRLTYTFSCSFMYWVLKYQYKLNKINATRNGSGSKYFDKFDV